ncbi:MAG TPA: tyrosine--tRNA ligase [Candidatus Limnocylindrales bacterium]|jgi:tyrosyl-tRNA synthetase
MSHAPDLLAELGWRGLLHQRTDGLDRRLERGPISAYVGFDPTGPSLHVGHLVQVFLLTHLQRAGGRPVALIGGGTGMIGDPSGKSDERNLIDDATLDANKARFREQLGHFIDFGAGDAAAVMLDNREWLGRYGLLEFLRDIGKHFTVPYMLAKDSVQLRLAAGLSFTEFSYMTLQAADFLHLFREHGVEMQMGGSDQWGNITAGLELIRRVEDAAEDDDAPAHALCSPLLMTPDGQKMGKTQSGAVFLDPALTRPYDFYQYLVNQPDQMVGTLLRWLTLLDADQVADLERRQTEQPETRPGQRAFAFDLTERVHGTDEATRQRRVADVLFSGQPIVDPDQAAELHEQLGGFSVVVADAGLTAAATAVASGLYGSNGDVRRAISQGGLTINDRRITVADEVVEALGGRWVVVRAGKRRIAIGEVTRQS